MKKILKHPPKLSGKSVMLLAVAAFTISTSSAFAQAQCTFNTNWTDGTGSWFNAANWSGGVPTSSLNAQINNSGTAQINSSLAVARACSLTLGSGAADSGNVSVSGNGSLVVSNSVAVGSNGRGTLSITAGSANSASLSISQPPGSSGTVTIDGTNSRWSISGAAEVGGGTHISPGGNGLLSLANGGTVTAVTVHVGISGTLAGQGAIGTSNGTSVDGILAPHNTLSLTSGNLSMIVYTTTQCNVIQAGPAIEVDNVVVQGNASLSGLLSVTMTGTFNAGQRFTLLTANGGLGGTKFSRVSITHPPNICGNISYDLNHVYLDVVTCSP